MTRRGGSGDGWGGDPCGRPRAHGILSACHGRSRQVEVLRDFAGQNKDTQGVIEAFGLSVLRMPLLPTEMPADRREMILMAGRAGFHQAKGRATPSGRPLDKERWVAAVDTVGSETLAAAIRPHDADTELAAGNLGEGNIVAARRPYRRGVAALAEADSLFGAPAGTHDVELLGTASV